MKKIILALIVATSFFAAEAQTTKSKSKKKAKKTYVSAESKAKAKEKAELARVKAQTESRIAEYKTASFATDSMRIDSERVARANFELERQVYLANRYKELDSTNQATWKRLSEQKEQTSKTEQNLDAVNKAANLGSYESRQVKIINQSYYDKAKVVTDNLLISEEEKKQQLVALNVERRTKIKAAIGKSKEKKLEKERKSYTKKFGQDSQAKWIDDAEGYATK